ncbi:hypothetical protein DXT99_03410 [Pontibacter diazotrophicus]|uniref:Peptide O-xylosyltransferase n=1 Tax=Pontibacter diazotrophicus TaxID=1400979 RepID=A0A3D8LHD1_9BACT|nr:beta-1,6-N-acetylglucosaminyltransferase [Pontibacter diazotrophicus]RDV16840.1 hypothetical protein DXT99_03410 [Pontibacter diazotrophicus]
MKRIAYLLFAHDNFKHLERLIEALNDKNVHFYLHIDKKSQLPEHLELIENVTFIKSRLKIYWAGFSLVKATMNLLTEAIKEKYDYYIVISGADYPIRPNNSLYKRLEEGGEYISIRKGFSVDKPQKRISQFYYEYYDRRNHGSLRTYIFSKLEAFCSKMVKRKFPFGDIYHGPDWYGLSHNCVTYIISFMENNPEFVKYYSTTLFPSESIFHTIIGNSKFKSEVKMYLTFTEWANSPSPGIINEKHIDIMKNQSVFKTTEGEYTPFFARKFDDTSGDLIKKINKELRNESS